MMLDLDTSPIPGQIGWAVLDTKGVLLQKSNELVEKDIQLLFQMLQESAVVSTKSSAEASTVDAFKRLTVTFPGGTRFLVTRDEGHVYVVQTRVG